MLKQKIYLGSLIAALSCAAVAPAMAEVPGFNVGIDFGRTEAKKYCENITNCSQADTGPKVEVGYAFNENFSLELGYTSFGTLLDSDDSEFTVSQDSRAITFSAIGTLPINDWFAIYGRGGVADYKSDSSGEVQGVEIHDRNGTTGFWGAGAKFSVSERFAIRVEYQGYMDISRVDGREDDVQGLFAGVLFQL